MRFSIILVALFAIVSPAQGLEAGATASLDVGVVQQAKDVYWSQVLNILRKVKIGDINFHHGWIHDNAFNIDQDAKNIIINPDPTKNGVRLGVNDLAASFQSNNFRYKAGIFPLRGSVHVSMSEVSVGVTLGLTQQTLADKKVVPAFTVSDVSVSLPSKHLKISIHGNFWSKIANAFKGLFKKTIVHTIEKELVSNIYS